MFKKAAFLFTFLCQISITCFSQNTLIPDPNFEQALIDLGYDTAPVNGSVTTSDISGITILNIDNQNISDLTGIEDFTALSILECTNNLLTGIDITNNSNLTQLFVDDNQLAGLDVSNNTLLQILWCDNNQLVNLDVTNTPELISLDCGENQLTNLDVTNNPKLNVLICDNNQLTSIDISQNISLDIFFCNNNALTTVDTSNNLDLKQFNCANNLLTSLDVTNNTELQEFSFDDNTIAVIDITNNTELTRVTGNGNILSVLDTSNNTELVELSIGLNGLSSLDLSSNTKLEQLNCVDNLLCFINIQNGNNSIITAFEATLNPFLSCVFVDDVAYSTTNWTNIDPVTNFVLSQSDCDALGNGIPDVDVLSDFVGSSYTLPPLTYGTYHTEPDAGGQQLLPGAVITTSQTIYIFSSTQCYTNESSFNVVITSGDFYIPKYFTPNNDNSHDTWKVIDNAGSFTSIRIYNRYGKLLKSLLPNNFEWDGTFNGQLMNTDDYWFIIYRDADVPIKGHFTLKR